MFEKMSRILKQETGLTIIILPSIEQTLHASTLD